jgi:uncharacterized LabA/DUF88 family protein
MSLVVKKERVIAYVDGFNLYFGMKQSGHNDILWLDIQKLILNLLRPNQELLFTKYFTSRIRNDPPKEKRQKAYIEALETLKDCKIFYGQYQSQIEECRKCGHTYPYSNEKMTDVNIAVEILTDAYSDEFDTAFLITGDSDLIPPINAVHNLFKGKRVFVAFPPNRYNVSVNHAAKGSMIIGRKKLKDSQLEDKIIKEDGYILERPPAWV